MPLILAQFPIITQWFFVPGSESLESIEPSYPNELPTENNAIAELSDKLSSLPLGK